MAAPIKHLAVLSPIACGSLKKSGLPPPWQDEKKSLWMMRAWLDPFLFTDKQPTDCDCVKVFWVFSGVHWNSSATRSDLYFWSTAIARCRKNALLHTQPRNQLLHVAAVMN
jgi:hypothetical protein